MNKFNRTLCYLLLSLSISQLVSCNNNSSPNQTPKNYLQKPLPKQIDSKDIREQDLVPPKIDYGVPMNDKELQEYYDKNRIYQKILTYPYGMYA